MVLLLGGPDEAIERDVEAFIHLPELGGVARRELDGRHVLGFCAVWIIFRPCSSVPVRKNTSLPSSR